MTRSRRLLALGLALASCGWAAGAAAQRSPSADALIEQGLALRARHRDAEALALFERAYARDPTPRAQAQIALAEGALGRWRAADRHLRAALAVSADPWIAGHRSILQDALRTIDENLGSVQVTGSATGATVRIAGEDAGTVPMAEPVFVEPGAVSIEIARPGAAVETAEVQAGAGERVEHRADAIAGGAADDPAGGEGGTAPVDPPADGDEPGGSSTLATIGVVGLVLAGASLITGVIAHVLREGHAADFNANPDCGTGVPMPTANCRSTEESFDRASTLTVVGYVSAGVFAAVSVVLLLAGGGDDEAAVEAQAQAQAARGCGLDASGVSCRF